MDSDPTRFEDPSEDHTAVLGHEATDATRPDDEAPRQIGRFVLLDVLGEGGMGRVFRAYDPTLAREVAIKLLHNKSRDPAAAERLVREAQSMAQVSHPNIVAIYEVGRDEGRVFLAMELVVGKTLRQWLKDGPPVHRIIDAFIQAAAGLGAAHEQGLVHRDFKPGNVFVGSDGRVRVGDFGLAKGRMDDGLVNSASSSDRTTGDSNITEQGSIIGTPPYMAPEQHAGHELTPACDQYAFGVALYEALEGQRPFSNKKLVELVRAKRRRETRPMSKATPRLAKAITRMLEPEPQDRFDSMTRVAEALAPKRKTGAAWTIGLGAALIAAVAFGNADTETLGAECEVQALDELWDDTAQAQSKQAFQDTGLPYAAATFESANERMHGFMAQWKAGRNDACLTASGDDDESQVLARARERCLDQGQAEFTALVTFLDQPSEDTVAQAPTLVAQLPELSRCRDPSYVRTYFGPAEVSEEALEPVRRELDRLTVRTRADELGSDELREFEAASERATQLDPVLGARSLSILAVAQVRAGSPSQGIETLQDAYNSALAQGLWADAAESAINLSQTIAYPPRPAEVRLAWADTAEAVLQHVDDRNFLQLRIEIARAESYGANGMSAPDRSLFHAGRAIVLASQRPEGDEQRNRAMRSYGLAVGAKPGQEPTAMAYLSAVLASDQAIYGESHPTVAADLNYITVTQFAAGRYEQASVTARRTHEVQVALGGRSSKMALDSLENVGLLCMESGDLECAQEAYAEVMEVRETTPDSSPMSWATTLTNVGDLYGRLGDPQKGVELIREGLELRAEAGLAPGHPAYSYSHMTLARHLLNLGEADEALESLEVALRQPHRVGNRDLADTYLLLTRALCERGAFAQEASEALGQARLAADQLRALPQPLEDGFRAARRCVKQLPEGDGGDVIPGAG